MGSQTTHRKIKALKHQLNEFVQAIRQLGSSSSLVCSIDKLKHLVGEILEVFRSNAASIYREYAKKGDHELPQSLEEAKSRKRSFPELLTALSVELEKFLKHLRNIPEFSDSRLSEAILNFGGWLVYRARGLHEFQGISMKFVLKAFY